MNGQGDGTQSPSAHHTRLPQTSPRSVEGENLGSARVPESSRDTAHPQTCVREDGPPEAMVCSPLHSFISALGHLPHQPLFPSIPLARTGTLGARGKAQLLLSSAVCPWAQDLTSLCLSKLLYKMG